MGKNIVLSEFKPKKAKNRRNKVVIEFDEKKRTEYLTGFTKRKNERRKRAKEEEIALLKQKKKSLKEQKGTDRVEHIQAVKAAIADAEVRQAGPTVSETTRVLDKHTVTITELDLVGGTTDRLGANEGDSSDSDEGKRPQSRPSADKCGVEFGRRSKRRDDNGRIKKPHINYSHAHHRHKKPTVESRRLVKKQLKRKSHQRKGGH